MIQFVVLQYVISLKKIATYLKYTGVKTQKDIIFIVDILFILVYCMLHSASLVSFIMASYGLICDTVEKRSCLNAVCVMQIHSRPTVTDAWCEITIVL